MRRFVKWIALWLFFAGILGLSIGVVMAAYRDGGMLGMCFGIAGSLVVWSIILAGMIDCDVFGEK